MTSIPTPDAYLGDGVYASFDGYTIWIRTSGIGADQRIALEPDVFDALVAFNTRIRTERDRDR